MDAVYADNIDEMSDEGDYEAGEEEEDEDGIEEEEGEGEGEEEAAQTHDGNRTFVFDVLWNPYLFFVGFRLVFMFVPLIFDLF